MFAISPIDGRYEEKVKDFEKVCQGYWKRQRCFRFLDQ